MAQSTLTPAATADNPPKDVPLTRHSRLSEAEAGAEDACGVIPAPAASPLVAASDRTGSFDMSRRQILGAGTIPSAAAMAAIFGPAQIEDPAFRLWRQWQEAETNERAAIDRYCYLESTLPEDVQPNTYRAAVQIDEEFSLLKQLKTLQHNGQCAAELHSRLAEISDARKMRHEAQAAVELPKAERAMNECNKRTDDLIMAVERARSVSPIAIAAKLHLALKMRGAKDFLEDYPYSLVVSILRDLVDTLPEDMAAAIRAEIDPQEATV